MKTLVYVGVLLFASVPASANTVKVELETSPSVGQDATVSPGEELYFYWKKYTVDGAKLGADTKAGQWFVEERISAGTLLVRVDDKLGFRACVPAEGTLESTGLCLLDDDNDGRFDRHSDGIIARRYKVSVPYERTSVSALGADAFKHTILFSGATGDTLRFSYREFNGDLARPAFTEELTVPREKFPQLIRLKGRTFELLGLNGLGLSYRLISEK